MAHNEKTVTTAAMVDEEGAPIPPNANMLPKGATPDERDVHWFFNWAEGEMTPSPTFSIFDQERLDSPCSVGSYHERVEVSVTQRRAAARAREIDQAFCRLSYDQVRTLQRWSLPPTVLAAPLRETFGRLAGVALRTASARQLGDDHALIDACVSVARGEKGAVAGIARHRAKRAIEAITSEASAALADAFAAFGDARRKAAAIASRNEARNAMAMFESALGNRTR